MVFVISGTAIDSIYWAHVNRLGWDHLKLNVLHNTLTHGNCHSLPAISGTENTNNANHNGLWKSREQWLLPLRAFSITSNSVMVKTLLPAILYGCYSCWHYEIVEWTIRVVKVWFQWFFAVLWAKPRWLAIFKFDQTSYKTRVKLSSISKSSHKSIGSLRGEVAFLLLHHLYTIFAQKTGFHLQTPNE